MKTNPRRAARAVSLYMGGPILGSHIRMGTGFNSMGFYFMPIYMAIYGCECARVYLDTDYIIKLSSDGNY